MPNKQKTLIDKYEEWGYNRFNWREVNPYESWDQYVVRKLRELRIYNEARKNMGKH